jgi:hypothetical protein
MTVLVARVRVKVAFKLRFEPFSLYFCWGGPAGMGAVFKLGSGYAAAFGSIPSQCLSLSESLALFRRSPL